MRRKQQKDEVTYVTKDGKPAQTDVPGWGACGARKGEHQTHCSGPAARAGTKQTRFKLQDNPHRICDSC